MNNPIALAADEAARGVTFTRKQREEKQFDYLMISYRELCASFRPRDIPNARGQIEWVVAAKAKSEALREKIAEIDVRRADVDRRLDELVKAIAKEQRDFTVMSANATEEQRDEHVAMMENMYRDLDHLEENRVNIAYLEAIRAESVELNYVETVKRSQYETFLLIIDAIMNCNYVQYGLLPPTTRMYVRGCYKDVPTPLRDHRLEQIRKALLSFELAY